MNKSESIGKLAESMSKAQASLKSAPFNRVNPHFKNRYADLTSVIDTARKPLSENGLTFMQFVSCSGPVVSVETVIAHSSGEWISGTLSLTASKPDPQGVGSAITYAKRYGLCAALGISADDDDDANDASTPTNTQRPVPQNGKAEASPKKQFADAVKGWAQVAPEDVRAACIQVAKAAGIDTNTPDADSAWTKATEYVVKHASKPFADWAKEQAK